MAEARADGEDPAVLTEYEWFVEDLERQRKKVPTLQNKIASAKATLQAVADRIQDRSALVERRRAHRGRKRS